MAKTADDIMNKMGFPASEQGHYVTLLRASIERQVRDHGLAGASYGSWAGNPDAEERARAFLEVEWAIAHGHSYQTECLDDFPINRYFSTRDMRWHYEFKPCRIAPWLRDQWRVLWFHFRVTRDRLLGRTNPFAN